MQWLPLPVESAGRSASCGLSNEVYMDSSPLRVNCKRFQTGGVNRLQS
jgi:hypothetical protein